MTLGNNIRLARKRKGWTQGELGKAVGLSQASISAIENDEVRTPPDPHTLIQIAEALDDTSLLIRHCQTCPVLERLFGEYFGDLSNERRDLSMIVTHLREKMCQASAVLGRFSGACTSSDFEKHPDDPKKIKELLEHLACVERGISMLKLQLMLDSLANREDDKLTGE